MLLRFLSGGMLLLVCIGLCGCSLSGEGQVDEQKNPYFIAGKERVGERDYKGAIEAFEKALEANPHSALAHFELGVLYEQHSDQKEEDYVAAMYHYSQAIKLRPLDYPADNARQRVASCKRELVKAESLAPVAQNLMRELDKLKEENQNLRRQLEAAVPSSLPLVRVRPPTNRIETALAPASNTARQSNAPAPPTRNASSSIAGERITPLPPVPSPARTHTVKQGDTAFSIARQYHVKLEALLAANPTLDPKRLKPGQAINLPSS
jgi:LysM repeat protein